MEKFNQRVTYGEVYEILRKHKVLGENVPFDFFVSDFKNGAASGKNLFFTGRFDELSIKGLEAIPLFLVENGCEEKKFVDVMGEVMSEEDKKFHYMLLEYSRFDPKRWG